MYNTFFIDIKSRAGIDTDYQCRLTFWLCCTFYSNN